MGETFRLPGRAWRIGCVSFLNSKPLIHELDGQADIEVRYDVPSALLEDLLAGKVDLALCPVIDYQRSGQALWMVPVGGIGCDGPTLTVRLYARVPWGEIRTLHVDMDSHTSVALAGVILAERWGVRPNIVPTKPGAGPAAPEVEAMLVIGDKVVTAEPDAARFPQQLDLGQAWKELTGLPFVFAIWMTKPGTMLDGLPERLARTREANLRQVDDLVRRYAGPLGWPAELARQYLGHWLRYEIEAAQLRAIERFFDLAHRHGLITAPRPVVLYPEIPAERT